MRLTKVKGGIYLLVSFLVVFAVQSCLEVGYSKTSIRFVHAEALNEEFFATLTEMFEEKNPNIDVLIELVPGGYDELMQKMALQYTAGNPADIYLLDPGMTFECVMRDMLLDLKPYIMRDINLSDYYPGTFDKVYWKGVPKGVFPYVLWYNKSCFDKVGAPYPDQDWDWKTYKAMAQRLTHGTGVHKFFGTDHAIYILDAPQIQPYIWQNEASFWDNPENPTKCVITEPGAIEAIEYAASFIMEHLSPTPTEIKGMDYLERESTGRIAMVPVGSWAEPKLEALNESNPEIFDWDIAPLPKHKNRKAPIFADSYCPMKLTKHPEEVWELLKFLISEEAYEVNLEMGVGGIPTLISLGEKYIQAKDFPMHRQFYADSIEHGEAPVYAPDWRRIQEMCWVPPMQEYLGGKISIQEMCRKVASQINQELTATREELGLE